MSKTVIGNINDTDAPPYSLSIGTVTTGDPNTPASAEITGENPNQHLSLVIPKGDDGEDGEDAPPYNLTIGTVTTGAPGSQATATITGDESNQQLNLVIPQGDAGEDGADATSIDTSNFARVQVVTTGLEDRPGESGGLVFWMDMRDDTDNLIPAMEPQDVRILPQGTAPNPPVAPVITTSALNSMTVGTAFSQTLTMTGTMPITVAITSGALPDGVTLSGDIFSGTPTTDGSGSVTISATNAAGSDSKVLAWTVSDTAEPGSAVSMFSGDYPYAQVLYNDGPVGLAVASVFYVKENPAIIKGGRVWVGTIVPGKNLTVWYAPTYNAGNGPGAPGWEVIPAEIPGQYVTIPAASIHIGWNEVTFPQTATLVPNGLPEVDDWNNNKGVWVGYYFTDPDGQVIGYQYYNTISPTPDFIHADNGGDLHMLDVSLYPGARRSSNGIIGNPSVGNYTYSLYGIDIIVEPA